MEWILKLIKLTKTKKLNSILYKYIAYNEGVCFVSKIFLNKNNNKLTKLLVIKK